MKVFIKIMLWFFICSYSLIGQVTNLNDSGAGSLRQEIADAVAGSTISFSVTGTITLVTELTIGKNLTINGPGVANLTISGNNACRIFNISGGTTIVNINNLNITKGLSINYGGGIENDNSTLNITSCVISNCKANGAGNGHGGGIDNYHGTVNIDRCRIIDNTAQNEGGGVRSETGILSIVDSAIEGNTGSNGGGISLVSASGTTELTRCTISGNKATLGTEPYGGGIIFKSGDLTLTNCTISGNHSEQGGGAIIDGSSGTLNIYQCTIVNNTASNGGGGLQLRDITANIRNTILAANTGPDGNNFYSEIIGSYTGGSLNSLGYNLCDGNLTDFGSIGDQTNATLNIVALTDNGGYTKTHELLLGSDAMDTIPEGGNSYNSAPATDQRGTARPQGANVDVGAYETALVLTVSTQAVTSITTTTATGNGNITSLGSSNPTSYGVCWNTGGTPTISDNTTNEGATSSTGAFTSNITSLNASTTYYVRAYATNLGGTSYGVQVSFTTLATPPTVSTQAVTSITSTTATGNGNITSLGIPNPTSHGFCWNTSGNPTNADYFVDNGGISVTGNYLSPLTDLAPGTTYYVRAYAVNEAGTAYGKSVTFKTIEVTPVITIINPKDSDISNGTISIKAHSSIMANPVEFYIDDDFLGNGVHSSASNSTILIPKQIKFNIDNAKYLFINNNNQLKKVLSDGQIENVFSTDLKVKNINLNSYGEVFVDFIDKIILEDNNFYNHIKINIVYNTVSGIKESERNDLFLETVDKFKKNIFLDLKERLSIDQKIVNVFDVDINEYIAIGYNEATYNYSIISTLKDISDNNFKTIAFLKRNPVKVIKNTIIHLNRATTETILNFKIPDNEIMNNINYVIDWNTMNYSEGIHKVKVSAYDKYSRAFSDEIEVLVRNFKIKLNALRKEDSAYTFKIHFAELIFTIDNSKGLPVAKYTVLRSTAGGIFEFITEIEPSILVENSYTFYDNIDKNTSYTYKIIAYDSTRNILSESEEKSI